MSEEILLQLFNRLGHIENTLHLLVESHKRLEAEQQEMRKEQQEIRREQQEMRKEQQEIRREQQEMRYLYQPKLTRQPGVLFQHMPVFLTFKKLAKLTDRLRQLPLADKAGRMAR